MLAALRRLFRSRDVPPDARQCPYPSCHHNHPEIRGHGEAAAERHENNRRLANKRFN